MDADGPRLLAVRALLQGRLPHVDPTVVESAVRLAHRDVSQGPDRRLLEAGGRGG